jgi:hypothetical protein
VARRERRSEDCGGSGLRPEREMLEMIQYVWRGSRFRL